MSPEVLVVGAGPTGLTAALDLAAAGTAGAEPLATFLREAYGAKP